MNDLIDSKASIFDGIPMAASVEAFSKTKSFREDKSPVKVNLALGAYRDDSGKPFILPVVALVERNLAPFDEQLSIFGYKPFTEAACRLLMGDTHDAFHRKKVFGVQCISGTGGLFLAGDYLLHILKYKHIHIPSPSFGNHEPLYSYLGFEVHNYRYWDYKKQDIDFDGMVQDLAARNQQPCSAFPYRTFLLKQAPPNSVVLLHACAHNPTGRDLSREQWMVKKQLFPLFDVAYQGFASGNLDEDAWPVRHFASEGMELLASQSFAKNMGLYNKRVGNLLIVTSLDENVIKCQMAEFIISNYKNPPTRGALIVYKILTNEDLRRQWLENLNCMVNRMRNMRKMLESKLMQLGNRGNWHSSTDQNGMFSLTNLDSEQIRVLMNKYHIYMLSNGRISFTGLNSRNIDYVACAIHDVLQNHG